ncbi:MAG: hypothetical protein WDM79_13175 [Terricaulis sp.]
MLAVWVWIYWGLPRVPDANALWSLNRQASIMFLDKSGDIVGVRGPYYGRRAHLDAMPELCAASVSSRSRTGASTNMRASIASPCCARSSPNLRAGETVQGGSTISQHSRATSS